MATATILVVEDEKIIAKTIEKRLKGMDYAVVGLATTGQDAIQKAMTLRPDLILMDISLGAGMDGIEAADRIRQLVNVPVVFLTAYSDPETLQRAKISEPFGYVLKPFDDKDLQTAIEIGLYRHKVELRLRQNEQWLAATLGSIGDGVLATDAQGRVRFLNAVAEQLTNWKQADALGRPVVDIFPIFDEKTREPVNNPAADALEKGEPVTLARPTILVDKAGTARPIDNSAAPIRDANGTVSGAVLVFRDISERRRLEEHLRQAQQLEAIGRLAGGIAHDFNNIMTVITGFSELLLADQESTPSQRESARTIYDAGHRAANLTQQIMAFSRKQMLIPAVLNLNTVIRDMETMIQRLLGTNIEFVTESASDLGRVKADPTQIGQIILNLVANAREAMPTGGRLVIATANTVVGGDAPAHVDLPPGRYALLSVTDTGTGMPAEVLAHIFEPFFTTKEFGQGKGLGLAMVFGIAKQSGGHIEATSVVGVGTTFRLYLPLLAEAPLPTIPVKAGLVPRRGETILLVEEDEPVRRMLKTILIQNGYQVLDASNGRQAAALVANYQAPIHLLLTDQLLPPLPRKPEWRVLLMSGPREVMPDHQGADAAPDSLQKPFGLKVLTTTVREILDRPQAPPRA